MRITSTTYSSEIWLLNLTEVSLLEEAKLLLLEALGPPNDPVLLKRIGRGRRELVMAVGG
jgi:hypothetical protein